MMKKRHIILCFLVFCLTATLLVGVTSSAEYDPWVDGNDDGIIDIVDIVNLAIRFGEEGTPLNKTALLLDLQERVEALETACMPGPLVLLGNYSGYFHSTSLEEDMVIMDTMIRTDKPAKFTVSVGASFLNDTGDTVTFHSEQNSGESSKTWVPTDIITADSNWKSFTYVGYGSFATYTDQNIVGMTIWWCIMVEGEEDTVVSFNPPF